MRTTKQVFWNLMDLELLPERYNFWPHAPAPALNIFFLNRTHTQNRTLRYRTPAPKTAAARLGMMFSLWLTTTW